MRNKCPFKPTLEAREDLNPKNISSNHYGDKLLSSRALFFNLRAGFLDFRHIYYTSLPKKICPHARKLYLARKYPPVHLKTMISVF